MPGRDVVDPLARTVPAAPETVLSQSPEVLAVDAALRAPVVAPRAATAPWWLLAAAVIAGAATSLAIAYALR